MATRTQEKPATREKVVLAPRHHLILLDDDDHTYEYVIEMLGAVFGYATERAFQLAKEVDGAGRAVVYTGPLEVAELKQEQIHAYGADWRLSRSAGSMTAVIEPAPE